MDGHWYDCRDQAIKWLDGRLVRMEIASDITESKETKNLSSALKLCQANVMLADNDLNIVYMNETVTEMLRKNEAALKKDCLNFRSID